MHPQLLGVTVWTLGDLQSQLLALSVELIDAADLLVNANDPIEWENAVLVGVGDQQGAWCDQCGNLGVVPSIGVDLKHAVAVALDTAVDHVVGQVGDSGDRDSNADPFVQGSDPPTVSAPPGTARDSDSVSIDFRTRLQVIQCPDAVPRLDPRRRVTASVPPPVAIAVGAMVNSLDFSQLQCVDGQAGVPVSGEPATVVLVVCLAAVTDTVLFDVAVSADVENRGQTSMAGLGQVEIAGDIKAGPGLELEFLDHKVGVFHAAGDDRMERSFGRPWREAQHLEELFPVLVSPRLPILESSDVGQASVGEAICFRPEVRIDRPITRSGVSSRQGRRRDEQQENDREVSHLAGSCSLDSVSQVAQLIRGWVSK